MMLSVRFNFVILQFSSHIVPCHFTKVGYSISDRLEIILGLIFLINSITKINPIMIFIRYAQRIFILLKLHSILYIFIYSLVCQIVTSKFLIVYLTVIFEANFQD